MNLKKLLYLPLILATGLSCVGCDNSGNNNSGEKEKTLLGLKDLVKEKFEFSYQKNEDMWDNPFLDCPYTLDDYMTSTLTTEMLDYSGSIIFTAKEDVELVSATITFVTKKDVYIKRAYYKTFGQESEAFCYNGDSLGVNVAEKCQLTAYVPFTVTYTFNKHDKDFLSVRKNKEFELGFWFGLSDGSNLPNGIQNKEWREFGIYNLNITGYYK